MTVKAPKVLYRYRHLQGDHREWTRQIITDSVLYFASPSSFNDPFDCKVHYKIPPSMKQLERIFVDFIRSHLPPGLDNSQQEMTIKKALSRLHPDNFKPEEFTSIVASELQKDVERLGVLSLSSTCKNNLLWSHYAASHTGICLKFIATEYTPFFGQAQQVKYRSTYPQIGILKHSPDKQVEAFLLTKAKDWKYEEEWRIIDHVNGSGRKDFPDELLVEVVFGARIDPKDKEEVLSWISKRKKPVQVSQAILSSGSYSLEILPYTH